MESTTVHIDKDSFGFLYCPFCGAKKRVSIGKFKDKRDTITTRCKCGKSFEVQLNSRKYYRKSLTLPGEVKILSSDLSAWMKIDVCDLSRSGLSFKMIEPAVINKGDTLRVRFSFETKKAVLIDREVIANFVDGDFLGCEFKGSALKDEELGFFLFS